MNEVVCGITNYAWKSDSLKAHKHVWTLVGNTGFETHRLLDFTTISIGAVSPSCILSLCLQAGMIKQTQKQLVLL